jgi:hypothetical protein
MASKQLTINVDPKRTVTAIVHEPSGGNGTVVVYAPGAGSNVHDPFGRFAATELAGAGYTCVRLQFPYMEEKRKAPDRTPVLEATWRAAIGQTRSLGQRLVVGGRSMGGRIASRVVAQGEQVDALVLYAYPLHSPAKPDVWRNAHFPAIKVPALFCSGTRDAFASVDELRLALKDVGRSALHVLDGADHGYAIPASTGRRREDVWQEAVKATIAWFKKVRLA